MAVTGPKLWRRSELGSAVEWPRVEATLVKSQRFWSRYNLQDYITPQTKNVKVTSHSILSPLT